MFPYRRLPGHVTALYVYEVISCLLLLHLVEGDVLVVSPLTNRTIREFQDFPASFGAPIPDDGVKGLVVYSSPPDACKPIAPPPDYPSNVTWIVLIRRLDCSFDIKVLNAQIAGYSAAIVHNVNSNSIEQMGSDKAQGIGIPSVFIGADDGKEIQSRFTFDKGYFIIITPGYPDFYNIDLEKYILPFVCVLGVCFLTTVITLIVRCIKDQRRRRRHRLSPSHLRKLPVRKFRKGDQYDTCAICLEEYVENEKLRELPCSHVYHTKCIDPWLTRTRRTCPVCKRKVFPPGTVNNESDEESDSETTPLLRSGGAGLPTNGSTFSQGPPPPPPASHYLIHSPELSPVRVPDVLIEPGTTQRVEAAGSVNGAEGDYVTAAENDEDLAEIDEGVAENSERNTIVEIGVDVVGTEGRGEEMRGGRGGRHTDRVV